MTAIKKEMEVFFGSILFELSGTFFKWLFLLVKRRSPKPTLSYQQVLKQSKSRRDMDRVECFVYDFPVGFLGLIMTVVILALLVKFTT